MEVYATTQLGPALPAASAIAPRIKALDDRPNNDSLSALQNERHRSSGCYRPIPGALPLVRSAGWLSRKAPKPDQARDGREYRVCTSRTLNDRQCESGQHVPRGPETSSRVRMLLSLRSIRPASHRGKSGIRPRGERLRAIEHRDPRPKQLLHDDINAHLSIVLLDYARCNEPRLRTSKTVQIHQNRLRALGW